MAYMEQLESSLSGLISARDTWLYALGVTVSRQMRTPEDEGAGEVADLVAFSVIRR
ncbi:hypothetical protein D3C76_810260 [compost metagenome]